MSWHYRKGDYDLAKKLLTSQKDEYLGEIKTIELNIQLYHREIKDLNDKVKALESKLPDYWGRVDKVKKAITKLEEYD